MSYPEQIRPAGPKPAAPRRMMRSGALVLGANIADSAAVLLRNVILARLLTVADFGIAATFSIMITLMDAAQNAGLARMIVQAKDADSHVLQDGLHGIQLVLGAGTAVLLLLLSWPYAVAMGTPGIVWAYAVIAIVPLIRGFGHLDSFRLQREHRFGPAAMRQIVPQLASLLVIWPAYLLLGDYRVALVAILVQQATALIMSHVGAARSFRIGFDPAIRARALSFGWPLMVNGLLMFFVFNGDRMIVSNQFGLQALGWFSAALVLTLTPTLQIARSLQTLTLPAMARVQDQPARLQRQHDLLTSFVMLICVGFVGGIALFGEPVLALVFGEKFRPAAPFLELLGVMQAIRLVRAVPAISATAKAETKNPLYTNIIRGLFIPLSLLAAVATGSIYIMLAIGIAGEGIAAIASALLAQRMVGLSPMHFLRACTAMLITMLAIGACWRGGITPLMLVPAFALLLYATRDFLLHSRELIRR